jgi:hypothetical protein
MSKNLIFLFLLISIIDLVELQEFDKDMMRAVACITLIKKLENKPQDQRELSTYILTCFISIDDATTQKLIQEQASNKLDLTSDQISKLTDMYQLQQKYTEDQIMDFSKALNDALEKLQKNAGGGMRNQQSSGFNNNNKTPQGSGLFEKIIGGIIGLFNPNDSLLLLVGFFVVFYLFLRQIRKWFDNSEKIKNKVNKSNKVKKKTK